MKSQETLSKIMELLNLQDEVKLESMKLENGTTIEAEAFEANQEVFIVTEEDEKIALPIGEYTLEDGRILVVAEEGIIAEVREEEEAPEEAPATEEVVEEVEQAEEEPKEEMSYATKEELSAAVEEMKAMIEEIKAMMSPKEEEEMAAEEEVKEVEMSSDEPAAKPIKHSPDTKPADMHKFSKGAKKDTLSRIFDKLG
jgi:crotonobetainyl-CoA:carnitine CoA-transferase CaiB-like acyl-CoA transferase